MQTIKKYLSATFYEVRWWMFWVALLGIMSALLLGQPAILPVGMTNGLFLLPVAAGMEVRLHVRRWIANALGFAVVALATYAVLLSSGPVFALVPITWFMLGFIIYIPSSRNEIALEEPNTRLEEGQPR